MGNVEAQGVAEVSAGRHIQFKLKMDSDPGKVLAEWEEKGYEVPEIFKMGLLALQGINPLPKYVMNSTVVEEFKQAIDRLERIRASIIANGGVATEQDKTELAETFDDDFLEGMQNLVRPGFTKAGE